MKALAILTSQKIKWLIVDQRSPLLYERVGNCMFGSDDEGTLWSSLSYSTSSGKTAFAGRSFPINMRDGTQVVCDGYWWDAGYDKMEEYVGEKLITIGISSVEELSRCYVFSSISIRQSELERMISECTGPKFDDYREAEMWFNNWRKETAND